VTPFKFYIENRFKLNLTALALILFGAGVNALDAPSSQTQPNRLSLSEPKSTVSLTYISWVEKLNLEQGALRDSAFATFSGIGLHYERHRLMGRRLSLGAESAIIAGKAFAGGTSLQIPYTTSRTDFTGAQINLKGEYLLTQQVKFALGVFALYRSIKWKTDPQTQANLSVTDMAGLNPGLLAELDIRFNREWTLRQGVGTLAATSTTYWILGAGYSF
jgi:hypothetical protein